MGPATPGLRQVVQKLLIDIFSYIVPINGNVNILGFILNLFCSIFYLEGNDLSFSESKFTRHQKIKADIDTWRRNKTNLV